MVGGGFVLGGLLSGLGAGIEKKVLYDRDAALENLKMGMFAAKENRSAQADFTKSQNDYLGNAALRISALPEEQRAAAWDSAIKEGERQGYAGLSQAAGSYSPDTLNGALARASMTKDALSAGKPDYQVVPEGGSLVNMRDPKALSEFAPPEEQRGGVRRVASLDEARSLPPGTQFIDPDGKLRIVPGGGGGNATGGFRSGNARN